MINCAITSPQKTIVYKNVLSVTIPAVFGQTQILPGHAESFILLKKGDILLRQLNKENKIIQNNTNGECYIKNDTVAVIL